MKIIDNPARVALRGYSNWANILGIIVLLAPEALYRFWQIDTNPRVWFWSALALLIFGTVGRFISQDRPSILRPLVLIVALLIGVIWAVSAAAMADQPKPQPAPSGVPAEAAFLEIGVPHVGQWEGLRLTAYLDRIASPPVWTVCYGETKGVLPGMQFSKRQCDDMLAEELISYRSQIHRHFTPQTKQLRLTAARDVAYTSLAYNAGVGAISKSTAVRRINAGDIPGGCTALTWWNKAGQRVMRGLVNRRAAEFDLCMRGAS